MTIYSAAADGYRDTTKWLAAFVPVAALASAGLLLGPRVLSGIGQDGLGTWLAANWIVALALTMVVAAIAAILWSAAAVLSVEAHELGALMDDPRTSADLAGAIGAGALLPHFFDQAEFEALMVRRNANENLTEAESTALANGVAAVRDWSIFSEMRRSFRRFVRVFVAAIAALGLGGLVALTRLGGAPIEAPTAVTVELSGPGTRDLARVTGCAGDGLRFVAVGGTVTSPVLDPEGAGCRYGATWHPRRGAAEISYGPPGAPGTETR